MTRRIRVKCIHDRTYLQETERGVVEEFGQDQLAGLTLGKVYEVLAEEHGYYRIVDDTGEDYLYPKTMFEVLLRLVDG
jgi:hypothetical protein